MKIAVTGTSSGFGKYLLDNWEGVYSVSLRDPIEDIVPKIEPANVFVNHAYSGDTKQSDVFYEVFKLWEYSPKTIINFGTSAIVENATFAPTYVTNKKHLINLASSVASSSDYKRVRVINFNPSTLENNDIFPESFSRLKFEDLYKLVRFLVELPQSVEVSDLIIKSTQRYQKTQVI